MFGFIADAITSTISILLPVFGTYKAIRTRDTATLTLWLIYWITLALVLLAESHFYFLLRWLPLYSWIRLGMYIYLVAPGQKHGSFFIYKEYIHPFLYRHEAQIDRLINQGNTRAFAIGWDLMVKTAEYLQARAVGYYAVMAGADDAFSSIGRGDNDHKTMEWNHQHSSQLEPRFQEVGSDEEYGFYSSVQKRNSALQYQIDDDRLIPRTHKAQRLGDHDPFPPDYIHESVVKRKSTPKDREEMLVQSALERISRAKAVGTGKPNLSQDEIEALERRLSQQPENRSPLVTPPATPAKHKNNDYSRSNSSSSLSSKSKKTRSTLPAGTSPQRNINNASRSHRKSSAGKPGADQGLPSSQGVGPSGIMVPGPNGVPVYAPLVYGQHSAEDIFDRSRSSSIASNGPSEFVSHMNRGDGRSVSAPNAARPQSSSSLKSLPEDSDWDPPTPQYPILGENSPYFVNQFLDDYDPTSARSQSWRSASGPAEIRYSSVQRSPPAPSKKGGRLGTQMFNSDMYSPRPRNSQLRREVDPEESSDDRRSTTSEQRTSNEENEVEGSEDDATYGARVRSNSNRSYYIQKKVVPASASNNNSATTKRGSRQRKGKRK